ncbi:MAG: hypothetical protein U5L08_10365 [Xanthomonadales bacterium]|nr:hypothetical protein [Xanthomonadales bacterium]
MLTKIKKRVETGVWVAAIVVPLTLCVFAFLGIACYFALLEVLPPALAALVTAAAGIVVIALVLVIARISGAPGKPSRARHESRESDAYGEEFEKLLREHADPVLARWIQDNPNKAAIATLALGVAAGYSEQFRRVAFDFYARYSESEEARRSGTRSDRG